MLDAMMNDIDEVMPEDRKREFYKLLIPQLRKSGEMSDSEYEGLMGELFGEGKAEGGIMNLGGNEMDLRGGGFVPLGAKEKADDVPARLSKNEFVMTADAVRAAGGGSVDKGADKMYKYDEEFGGSSIMAITETRNLPAQFIEDLGKDYAKQLTATTAVPVDTSKFAPTVASQDPLQQQAATLAGSGIGSFQPYLQAAEAATGPQAYQAYMSPYQSQVIDTTLSEFDRQKAIQEKSIADQAIASGAFGGGREGVQRAEFASQSGRDRAALQAQYYNKVLVKRNKQHKINTNNKLD
jgi:hypothetical protein